MKLVVGGMHQGKTSFAHTLSEQVCDDLQLLIRGWMEQGENCQEHLGQIETEYAEGVIVVAEIGCGLVPMDAFEREYREVVGRISCELAARADEVYRMTCGLATRIK